MVNSIFDLNYKDWQVYCAGIGQKKFRAKQIWQGLFKNLYSSPDEFTNIPKELINNLKNNYQWNSLELVDQLFSSDNETEKFLFRLPDGKLLETVLMRYSSRRTICISTQSGCAMGCEFCATGKMGFHRHLSPGEIIEQVLYIERRLRQKDDQLTNIVVMGMGEPFHNYDNVLKSMYILNDKEGFNFGARRITISTVGLIPGIERFSEEPAQFNLAVSLHAADDQLRSSMMPVNKKFPIPDLIQACRMYVEKTNRRVTFEWALVNHVNDTRDQAKKLSSLLKGLLCHVNLIPLNPIDQYSGQKSEPDRVKAFYNILSNNRIPCSIRVRRGIDISAGCGQLAGKHS